MDSEEIPFMEFGIDFYQSIGDMELSYADVEEENSNQAEVVEPEISYVVLSEVEIRRLQENDIERVSTVLSITEIEATILLLHYQWNVSKIYDEWFGDEQKVRRTVGILEHRAVVDRPQLTCGICFDSFPNHRISTVSCGHRFCNTCWTTYIRTSINREGRGCLLLKCPYSNCPAAVGYDMVYKQLRMADQRLTMMDQRNYYWYFIRSYAENKKNMKWCPASRCTHAIDFAMVRTLSRTGLSCYDVTCLCSHKFCWNCSAEAHSPVDCNTFSKWYSKHIQEAKKIKWIVVTTKPCPKCKTAIERKHGCMHMICSPECGHEFCWVCLCEWKDHQVRSCNRYINGAANVAQRRRKMQRNWSEKYTHYFERWESNEASKKQAMFDLKKLKLVLEEELRNIQSSTESEMITEAWLQVIECRRVLKWTYVYGYYMPEDEQGKLRLFEYLQGEAESWLEKLHECLEKELEMYLKAEYWTEDYSKFMTKLIGLTKATKVYFQNLVKALENGLAEVNS